MISIKESLEACLSSNMELSSSSFHQHNLPFGIAIDLFNVGMFPRHMNLESIEMINPHNEKSTRQSVALGTHCP
jgi:hypothetical protein